MCKVLACNCLLVLFQIELLYLNKKIKISLLEILIPEERF